MKKINKNEEQLSLSKFLAHAGVASRRKVVEIIKAGKVSVNNNVVTEPGFKIISKDVIKYAGKVIKIEQKLYILLNKPRGCVTTVSDEKGRKTVMDVLSKKIKERIYPVGRLDYNTTGLLLLTNDGYLAQHLAHPKYEIEKVYTVCLDKELAEHDMQKIKSGVKLKDGFVDVDTIYFLQGKSKKYVGVVLHSGAYRVVRRLFEKLGYRVNKLDRARYAGLTKGGLKPGEWRYLTKEEVKKLRK